MITLAFNTCTGRGAVAVIKDGKVLAQIVEQDHRRLAERLVPMIDAALAQAGIGYKDLGLLAVTHGPGSFTGVRIGVATARAIALASGIAAVGVSVLQVIAQQTLNKYLEFEIVGVCMDARRNETYVQAFVREGAICRPIDPPFVCPVNDLDTRLPEGVQVVVGTGAHLIEGDGDVLVDDSECDLDLAVLASVSAPATSGDSLPEPLYLRAPDAKLPQGKTLVQA